MFFYYKYYLYDGKLQFLDTEYISFNLGIRKIKPITEKFSLIVID